MHECTARVARRLWRQKNSEIHIPNYGWKRKPLSKCQTINYCSCNCFSTIFHHFRMNAVNKKFVYTSRADVHTHTHNLTMVIRNFLFRQYFLCRHSARRKISFVMHKIFVRCLVRFDWIHTLHGWTSKLIGQWENNYVHRIVRKLKTKKIFETCFFAQLYVINLFIVGFTFSACVCVMYKICGRMNFAKKKE